AKSIDHLLNYIDTQILIGALRADLFSQDMIHRARSISSRLSGIAPTTSASGPAQQNQASQPSDAINKEALGRLCEKMTQLHSMAPQARGFSFEKFLNEL